MTVLHLDAQDIGRFRDHVLAAALPAGDEVVTDAARVDLLAELEALKSAACALQADLAVDLDASVRSRDARQGVRPERRGRGVAAQIGLARRESPARAATLLGLAKDLATDLTCTRQALRDGRINEYRAQTIAVETGPLTREDRALVDDELCAPDPETGAPAPVDTMGTGQLAGAIRRRVQALDPAAVARRRSKAEAARRVSIRPTEDTMVYLTGTLPVVAGVAAFAALSKQAEALVSQGDERTKGQIMADLMVERLTGQKQAADTGLTIDLVISDESLLGAGNEPAVLPDAPGAPTIPAQVAREVVGHALDARTTTWIRSLYADPTGRLVAMTRRQRFVTGALADFLKLRDQGLCRTPWCDAPVRHHDHVTPAAHEGATSDENTQGLCQACNFAKQADGWRHRTVHDDAEGRHTVETITPTGHRHRSRAPAPPTPARARTTAPTHHPVVEIHRPAFDLVLADDFAA